MAMLIGNAKMFTSPKRHAFHDFPPSLAVEYLKNLNAWEIPKSWSRRQVNYAEYTGYTVVHHAIRWCSDSVVLEFCNVLGDTINSKKQIPLRLPSPLTYAIQEKRSFNLIYEMARINGSVNKSGSWLASHSEGMCGVLAIDNYFSTYAAVMHPEIKIVSAMLDAGLTLKSQELYIALLYSETEIFELLLRRAYKNLEWMKVIKLILLEYEKTIVLKLGPKHLQTDMQKVQSNLTKLIAKQSPTHFHSSFLAEKTANFEHTSEVLQYFYEAGFPKINL
ncbi:hypothetical protein N8760_03825 [Rhodobacteraceae bacterium]|nr:hypothetical protein [Paracoccaceae bacterium]